MFIEINDISTGTTVQETLNSYSINYVYSKQEGGKYLLIYVLVNGIRKIEEFNSQSDLNNRIEEIGKLRGNTKVYTYKGSCTFENLPTSGQVAGDVWNVTNDFTLGGKDYPAGTNVAWDGTNWDALAGSIDLSNYITFNDLITNADIDNLFNNRFTLLLGYSDTVASGGEHALCIATQGLTFPSENFDEVYPYYIPLSSDFEVSASYNGITVDIPYTELRIVQETQDIGFQGDGMLPIIAETGGSLMGVSFTFHIPQDQVYLNGVGNKEKNLTFVYPEPIDGSVYPDSNN